MLRPGWAEGTYGAFPSARRTNSSPHTGREGSAGSTSWLALRVAGKSSDGRPGASTVGAFSTQSARQPIPSLRLDTRTSRPKWLTKMRVVHNYAQVTLVAAINDYSCSSDVVLGGEDIGACQAYCWEIDWSALASPWRIRSLSPRRSDSGYSKGIS